MRLRFLSIAAALALGGLASAPSRARACGACFHGPSESTVVTGHRMAMSVSPAQTVLWDSIQYAGDPKEFAWVLPVKPGAVVETSTDAWFETLEAATQTSVQSPNPDCGPIDRGGCFGSAMMEDAALASGGALEADPVQVVHEGTVGPYETVTLSTKTPGALETWLGDHGFVIDPSMKPVVDAYVAEGFDFIALRLQPGKGVREMTPVRVVTPGAGLSFPLRMVAGGTGAKTSIVLYVIGEGRWQAKDRPNAVVDPSRVFWDFAVGKSNYPAERAAALAAGDGGTFLTTYARQGSLLGPVFSSFSSRFYAVDGAPNGGSDTIAGAYALQAAQNGETTDTSCIERFPELSTSSSLVEHCAQQGCAPGSLDAGTFACGEADDVAVALTGMHPADVWVTRLEAELPRAALAQDLVFEPAPKQQGVENQILATGLNDLLMCSADANAVPILGPASSKKGGGGGAPLSLGVLAAAAALMGLVARRFGRAPALGPRS